MSTGTTPAPSPGIAITLDKVRHIRYSWKTRREMLEALGGEQELMTKLTGDKLCLILWYGLKWEDPELTLEQLEEIVDLEHFREIVDVMTKALGYKTKLVSLSGEPNPQQAAPAGETGAAASAS